MTAATGFRPLSLDELFSLTLPERQWVVDELLPLGHVALVSGREKSGKGLLTVDLVASVALGETFLDRAVLEGAAIYAAGEEDVRDVRDRIATRVGDRRDAPLYTLMLDGSTGDRLSLDDADGMQRLFDMVQRIQPVVLVLDVLREFHSGDENSSDHMGPIMRPLRELGHLTGTAICVNHHQNRAGSYRGSTAIGASVDLLWSLVSDGDDDGPPAGVLRVEGRHGPRQRLPIRFEPTSGRWEPASGAIVDLIAPDRIVLHLETVNDWRTARQIADEIARPLKTVQNELSRLRALVPCPIAVAGAGTKANPGRYRAARARLDLDDDCSQTPAPSREPFFGNNNSAPPSQRFGLFPNGLGNNPVVPIRPGNNGNHGSNP